MSYVLFYFYIDFTKIRKSGSGSGCHKTRIIRITRTTRIGTDRIRNPAYTSIRSGIRSGDFGPGLVRTGKSYLLTIFGENLNVNPVKSDSKFKLFLRLSIVHSQYIIYSLHSLRNLLLVFSLYVH